MRLREISKVISFGVEGKKFSKRWWRDVLLVLFWLGTLEFKILKFLFFCCLNIFLGILPRFLVHKSLRNRFWDCSLYKVIHDFICMSTTESNHMTIKTSWCVSVPHRYNSCTDGCRTIWESNSCVWDSHLCLRDSQVFGCVSLCSMQRK